MAMDLRRSEAEFLKFLDYVGNKGLLNPTTAYARKKAAEAILAVLDADEKNDLGKLERDSAFLRFQNKNAQKYRPDSLTTYRQRFNSALDDFLRYVENPAGFRPGSAPRASRRAAAEERAIAGTGPAPQAQRTSSPAPSPSAPDGLLPYPIPLSTGEVAQLYLPPKLNTADATKISNMVTLLVKALTEVASS